MKYFWLVLVFFFWVASADAAKLKLAYSMNLNGEIEPCGCATASDHGGLLRRASWLDQKRQEDEFVTLSFGGLFAPERLRDQIKDRFILKGLTNLNYQAIGLQNLDLVHGVDFLGQSPTPLVAFNYTGGQVEPFMLIDVGKHQLFFTQWMGDWNTDIAAQQLSAALQTQKDQGNTTLLATTLSMGQIESLPLQLIDILAISPIDEQIREPILQGTTLVIQPGTRGQQMGWLQLNVSSKGNIKKWQHTVDPLDSEYEDAPRLLDWYKNYNGALKQDYQERVVFRKKMMSGVSLYTGAKACESCHQEDYDLWQTTKHANAWQHLEQKNKTFDPDCLSCHTVGLNQADGFLDMLMTPHLTGIQCETCHGAGRGHVESLGVSKLSSSAQVCGRCHIPDHSPEYNSEEYWQSIAH